MVTVMERLFSLTSTRVRRAPPQLVHRLSEIHENLIS
jgi:hypothetical protein